MTPGRGRLAKVGTETTNNGGRASQRTQGSAGARQRAERAAERWVTADTERQVSGKQRGRLGVLDFLLFSTQAGAGDPALGSDKIADVVRAMRKRRELLLTGRRAGKFDALPGGEDGIRGSVPPIGRLQYLPMCKRTEEASGMTPDHAAVFCQPCYSRGDVLDRVPSRSA